MKKTTGLMLATMAVMLLWGATDVHAQQQRSVAEPDVLQRSLDGASGTVLHAGTYRLVSLVGQSVGGTLGSRSGGIWHVQQAMRGTKDGPTPHALSDVPATFSLEANYPNPFNPQTTIAYALPEAAEVTIQVFDLLGQKVADLVAGNKEAGNHTLLFDGSGLASGVYLYRMQAGSFEAHRTMLLLK